MTCAEIEREFKRVLRDIQRESGFPDARVEDDTVPLRDLEQFDSLSALDAETRLAAVLGEEVDAVPFKAPKDGHEMTVVEIVEHLCKRYGTGKAK